MFVVSFVGSGRNHLIALEFSLVLSHCIPSGVWMGRSCRYVHKAYWIMFTGFFIIPGVMLTTSRLSLNWVIYGKIKNQWANKVKWGPSRKEYKVRTDLVVKHNIPKPVIAFYTCRVQKIPFITIKTNNEKGFYNVYISIGTFLL